MILKSNLFCRPRYSFAWVCVCVPFTKVAFPFARIARRARWLCRVRIKKFTTNASVSTDDGSENKKQNDPTGSNDYTRHPSAIRRSQMIYSPSGLPRSVRRTVCSRTMFLNSDTHGFESWAARRGRRREIRSTIYIWFLFLPSPLAIIRRA